MPKESLTIRQEGSRVLLLFRGKCIADLPPEAALAMADGIRSQARRAEEVEKANLIIPDQALCQRLCLPFGLTNNPLILKEAWKESQYLKAPIGNNGVGPTHIVGTPSLKRSVPNGRS